MKHAHYLRGAGMVSGFGQALMLVMLVMTAAALYAPLKNNVDLRAGLAAAQERESELEILYPLYAEIATLDAPDDWAEIEAPTIEALREAEVVEIPARFTQIASACSVELAAIRPRVEQRPEGNRFLQVELLANGPYEQLKDFLMQLARLPVLDRLEKIDVRREGRQERFHVIAHLALRGEEE